MERAHVIKDEIAEQGLRFLAVFMETSNSCLTLLSEKEDKIGTLAVAVPKPKELMGPITSSVLLGDKNAILARTFAEYVASKKGRLALVSIYLEKATEAQAQSILRRLIEKVLHTETRTETEATSA